MPILAIAGLTVAPVFIGFLMEPLFPLGHWAWGVLLFLALLPGAIYWRRTIWSYVSRAIPSQPNQVGVEASATFAPMSSRVEVQKGGNPFSWRKILIWPILGTIFAVLLLTVILPHFGVGPWGGTGGLK